MAEWRTEINGSNYRMSEQEVEDAIGKGWADCDREADESLADFEAAVMKADLGVGLHFADLEVGCVLQGRELLRESAWARPIARDGRLQGERLMGPHEIINLAPAVELALRFGEIAELAVVQQLQAQGAMEALVLALGLRMTRTAVKDCHPRRINHTSRDCRPPFLRYRTAVRCRPGCAGAGRKPGTPH